MPIQNLTYAGHSAVFFQTENSVIAVDPWLAGNPRCPESLKEPHKLDLIVLTHGHADHASDAVRLAKSTGASIAATYELAMLMISEGVPEGHVIPMNKGGSAKWNGLSITLTHAFHSSSYDTATGPVYAGEPCGVVLGDGQQHIYHAGDTALFSDMALIGQRYSPSLALLPIGDVYTMGPAEAAQAAELLGVKRAIPIHYATFPGLTGTADEFKAECGTRGIEAIVLEPGAAHELC